MPRGWSLRLGAAQGSRLHREQRYHPRCLAWMPLAWHRSAFPVPRSASPPNNLVLGIQGVAVGWEKGRMAHGAVTGLQSSREEYLLHTRSRGCRSSLLQLVLSCTFRKYQRNGTWHVCEAELLSLGVPRTCRGTRPLGEWTPGETSRTQRTPSGQGLKRSPDADGEGRPWRNGPGGDGTRMLSS